MYAVIETGGKQYRVTKGDRIEVEKLEAKESSEVVFDRVLLLAADEKVEVGTPVVKGGKVVCEVLTAEKKGDKIIAFKYKRRKGYHRKIGHRQKYTVLKVTDIVRA